MAQKNIIFTNEPKLSEYEAHKTFNERRLKLLPLIKEFISNHEFFKDTESSVTFIPRGIGSVVCRITTLENSYVLKVPLSLKYADGEAEFLSVWEKAGIKVPKIYESGRIGEHQYILMEYIDTPTLEEKYNENELIEKDIFFELGQILQKLHKPRIEGFGRVVEGKPEFKTFEEWLSGNEMGDRIQYSKDNDILTEELVPFDSFVSILVEHVKKNGQSMYCHIDFGVHNVFATNPYTVFDPNPRFNCAYFDLGKALLMGTTKETPLENEQLLKGYFGENSYDDKALHAFIVLNGYYKAPDWHKKKRDDLIKGFQSYLSKRRGLLQ
jgi:fructosamine-3-kinase